MVLFSRREVDGKSRKDESKEKHVISKTQEEVQEYSHSLVPLLLTNICAICCGEA